MKKCEGKVLEETHVWGWEWGGADVKREWESNQHFLNINSQASQNCD